MPEYTQDELEYIEGHAASCICVKCEDLRKLTDNAVAAMSGVTIPDGHDPKGAVAALWRAAKVARGALSPHFFHADTIEALDDALARFEVDETEPADTGGAGR